MGNYDKICEFFTKQEHCQRSNILRKLKRGDKIIIFIAILHSLVNEEIDVHPEQVKTFFFFNKHPCNMIYLIILNQLLQKNYFSWIGF